MHDPPPYGMANSFLFRPQPTPFSSGRDTIPAQSFSRTLHIWFTLFLFYLATSSSASVRSRPFSFLQMTPLSPHLISGLNPFSVSEPIPFSSLPARAIDRSSFAECRALITEEYSAPALPSPRSARRGLGLNLLLLRRKQRTVRREFPSFPSYPLPFPYVDPLQTSVDHVFFSDYAARPSNSPSFHSNY